MTKQQKANKREHPNHGHLEVPWAKNELSGLLPVALSTFLMRTFLPLNHITNFSWQEPSLVLRIHHRPGEHERIEVSAE